MGFDKTIHRNALLSFISILMAFLVITDITVINRERSILIDIAKKNSTQKLQLIGLFIREAAIRHDYGAIENFIIQWAKEHEDVLSIRAVAENNFELVNYKSEKSQKYSFNIEHSVEHDGVIYLRLFLVKDFSDIAKLSKTQSFYQILWSLFLSSIMGVILWFTFRKIAINPIEKEIQKRKTAEEALIKANDELETRVKSRTSALEKANASLEEEIIQRNFSEEERIKQYYVQNILNSILNISLKPISLTEQLTLVIEIVLTIPWLSQNPKGCIYIADTDNEVLILKAHVNFSDDHIEACSRVPFNKCVCGITAFEKKIMFTRHFPGGLPDGMHYEMEPHSHYSLPVMSQGNILGVMNLYLEKEHIPNKKEEDILQAVTNTLAGIIVRKQVEDKLRYTASYDSLTGLPNRELFFGRLEQEIILANQHKQKIAILYIDIDNFKQINDNLGHNYGDGILKDISNRIASNLKETSTVSRISGDEFIVIMPNIADRQETFFIVNNIISSLKEPVTQNGISSFVTASIGISIYPDDADNLNALVKSADLAMYHAKKEKGSYFYYYTGELTSEINERIELENELKLAIERNEFVLYYQPKIDLSTGKAVGAEALIRWIHPVKGFIPPDVFIPLAEETGLIIQIGEWVLTTACKQVLQLQNLGLDSLSIAVNMSLVQFTHQEDLVKRVSEILEETKVESKYIEIEVTESVCMENINLTISKLLELNALGIHLSVDDFGTGYSSLVYLKDLPFTKLKIDRAFISDIPRNVDELIIVKTIIEMAHNLNKTIVAEGIETQEQADILKSFKCEEGQGYFFSKPVPADDFIKWLKNHS